MATRFDGNTLQMYENIISSDSESDSEDTKALCKRVDIKKSGKKLDADSLFDAALTYSMESVKEERSQLGGFFHNSKYDCYFLAVAVLRTMNSDKELPVIDPKALKKMLNKTDDHSYITHFIEERKADCKDFAAKSYEFMQAFAMNYFIALEKGGKRFV